MPAGDSVTFGRWRLAWWAIRLGLIDDLPLRAIVVTAFRSWCGGPVTVAEPDRREPCEGRPV